MDLRSLKENINDALKLFIFISTIFIIIIYVVSVTQVVGISMQPTLTDGNVLVLDKLSYRFQEVKRGDIISLDYVDTKNLIKRVIGLPGEHVSIKNSKVYINGKLLSESYISKNIEYSDFDLADLGYDVIPENMYFVLGDNRTDGSSIDSRRIGLIKKKSINGKIILRFWPINKIDTYFKEKSYDEV